MLDSLLSILTFAVCIWILINVGARMPKGVQGINKKIKKVIRSFVKSLTADDE